MSRPLQSVPLHVCARCCRPLDAEAERDGLTGYVCRECRLRRAAPGLCQLAAAALVALGAWLSPLGPSVVDLASGGPVALLARRARQRRPDDAPEAAEAACLPLHESGIHLTTAPLR